jgi:hypothetical protein
MRPGLLYLVAGLIAGATPVRAQTLPYYDMDAEVATCEADAEKRGKEFAEKNHGGQDAARSFAEAVRSTCKTLLGLEKQTRDELAKHWSSHDSNIRLKCIATGWVVDYTGLEQCIAEIEKKRGPFLFRSKP